MRARIERWSVVSVGLIGLGLTGCLEGGRDTSTLDEPVQTVGNMVVDNSSSRLGQRVSYQEIDIPIDPLSSVTQKVSIAAAAAKTVTLTLVAEIAPPTYLGTTLQATEVRVKGHSAYVAYNVRGETFLGAVDVFDISNSSRPKLVSSVVLTDTDVNALAIDGETLFIAGATGNVHFASPAVLQRIELSSGRLTTNSQLLDLPSYAGTAVDVKGDSIYVMSGAAGGVVSIVSRASFLQTNSFPLDDARGVDVFGSDVAVVAGTDGRLVVLPGGSLASRNTFAYNGTATIPESKSTVELKGDKAILALGNGGTKVVCLATGQTLADIAPPNVAGLDASVTVTNAATANQNTLFSANGEAGVYVAQADHNFTAAGCAVDNLTTLGKLRFSGLQSANHVLYRGKLLFVAAGLGGLKIVTVENSNSVPDNDDTE